ncbi:hypothetical protein Bca4012_049733 [Brassica carinata]
MPDDDGHKQCSTDVIVKERLGKFEAVQELVTKYEVKRSDQTALIPGTSYGNRKTTDTPDRRRSRGWNLGSGTPRGLGTTRKRKKYNGETN